MTNEKSYVNMMTTNPVLTVAPPKEETEMFGATEKITALYCRLSQEDERAGERKVLLHGREPRNRISLASH